MKHTPTTDQEKTDEATKMAQLIQANPSDLAFSKPARKIATDYINCTLGTNREEQTTYLLALAEHLGMFPDTGLWDDLVRTRIENKRQGSKGDTR